MKHLPKTLQRSSRRDLEPDERRALTRLARDGRTRLVYGLVDTGQTLPHRAVLLRGRDIAGWVLGTYQEFNPAGAGLYSRRTDSIVLAEARQIEEFNLPYLCTEEIHIDADGRETTRREWSRVACEELTYRYGMVEVISMDGRFQSHRWRDSARGMFTEVLIPTEAGSWEWGAVLLDVARMRAIADLKPRCFWNLPTQAHPFRIGGIDTYRIKTICPAFPERNPDQRPSPRVQRGAVEITAERGTRSLRIWRHNSDCLWSLDYRDTGAVPVRLHQTYATASGATALEVAVQAWESGKLPRLSSSIDASAETEDFKAFVEEQSVRLRALEFVAEALDLPDPLAHAVAQVKAQDRLPALA